MIIVTVNGVVFDFAKDNYKATVEYMAEMYELTEQEESELLEQGEVSTNTVYIEVYEE